MLAIWTRRQTFIYIPDDDDQVEVVQSRNIYRVCHQISTSTNPLPKLSVTKPISCRSGLHRRHGGRHCNCTGYSPLTKRNQNN